MVRFKTSMSTYFNYIRDWATLSLYVHFIFLHNHWLVHYLWYPRVSFREFLDSSEGHPLPRTRFCSFIHLRSDTFLSLRHRILLLCSTVFGRHSHTVPSVSSTIVTSHPDLTLHMLCVDPTLRPSRACSGPPGATSNLRQDPRSSSCLLQIRPLVVLM